MCVFLDCFFAKDRPILCGVIENVKQIMGDFVKVEIIVHLCHSVSFTLMRVYSVFNKIMLALQSALLGALDDSGQDRSWFADSTRILGWFRKPLQTARQSRE